jgi:menaquinone-dependent protoporphyrinogen oxidase
MPKKALVAYSTWAGSTTALAEAVADGLRDGGLDADVLLMSDVDDVRGYDLVVAGAPVHAGRPHPGLPAFLGRHAETLRKVPVAYFVACMTMKEDTEENREESRGFLKRATDRFPGIEPVDVGLFAGAIPAGDEAREKLSFLSRLMLKATKAEAEDERDPDAARRWGRSLVSRLS